MRIGSLALLLALVFATGLFAHGGGLDSQGGHNDSSPGTYHFHQGPLAGQVYASKAEATAALQADDGAPPALPGAQLPPVPEDQIRLASWNIRIFSTGSRDDTELSLIADRLQQSDLIAIQEVRGREVVDRTLAILAARGEAYEALVSPPVGCGVLERYAIVWRPEKVALLDAGTVWPDPSDQFIREPFIASFRAGAFDLTLISVHVIYGDGVGDRRAEALLLDDVYQSVQDADPDEQDVILLGAFNLPPDDPGMVEVDAALDPVFSGTVRTTVSDAGSYDNIWWDASFTTEATGGQGVDSFDQAVFGGRDAEASLAVSDHRPIWVDFYSSTDDDGHGETLVEPTQWGVLRQND